MNKYTLTLLLFIVTFVYPACNKCDEFDTRFQFSDGCIPDNVNFYQNTILTGEIDRDKPFSYDFDDDLVLKHKGYLVNYSCGTLQSIKVDDEFSSLKLDFKFDSFGTLEDIYRANYPNPDTFKLVYKESKLVKAIEGTNRYEYSYSTPTMNIDTMWFYQDSVLTSYYIYEYDEKNHPYSNLNVPPFSTFGFDLVQPKNNITRSQQYSLVNDSFRLYSYRYLHTYNTFDFPTETIKINEASNVVNSTLSYSYINCD